MAILTTGQTFATGDQVTATKLNAIANSATFDTGAVDNSTTQLSGGAIIVKDAGITAAKLASDAVTTVKILDANVTAAKLASDAVTTAKILDANVTAAKLATLTTIDINGGTIDGAVIGGSSAAAITGTTITGTTITGTAMNCSGSILGTSTGHIGFATGAGGSVTQGTSKSTGVTLNKMCGNITTHDASLAAGTIVSFGVSNSLLSGTNEVAVINHISGGTQGAYTFTADISTGNMQVYIRNNTAGALAEALVLKFIVLRAPSS